LIPKQWQVASGCLQNAAARVALLLPLFLLGCSALSLPREDAPASGPDPAFNTLVAKHIKRSFKDYASYDSFEISEYRWVHSVKGWSWLTCVRFQDKGRRLTYALFIKQDDIIEYRYAVVTDACDAQNYSPFAQLAKTKSFSSGGLLEPLY
jgi:hypothetical protein